MIQICVFTIQSQSEKQKRNNNAYCPQLTYTIHIKIDTRAREQMKRKKKCHEKVKNRNDVVFKKGKR